MVLSSQLVILSRLLGILINYCFSEFSTSSLCKYLSWFLLHWKGSTIGFPFLFHYICLNNDSINMKIFVLINLDGIKVNFFVSLVFMWFFICCFLQNLKGQILIRSRTIYSVEIDICYRYVITSSKKANG